MGSRRKMGAAARLIATSCCTPAVPVPSVRHAGSPEPVIDHCAQWLTIDFEIDRLSQRWAALETRMAREFGWFGLQASQRQALPEAAEMTEIEQRLDQLSDVREQGLKALAMLEAKTLHEVASKLAVAARVLLHEGGPAHRIVADAVRELAARRCSACGAAYVGDAKHP